MRLPNEPISADRLSAAYPPDANRRVGQPSVRGMPMHPPGVRLPESGSSTTDGPFELRLGHRRASGHARSARFFIKLSTGAATRPRMRWQATPPCRRDVLHRGPAGGSALSRARPLLVDRSGSYLLGHIFRVAMLDESLLDVSELALALGAPRLCGHRHSFRRSRCRQYAGWTTGRQNRGLGMSHSHLTPRQTPNLDSACTALAVGPTGRPGHAFLVNLARGCHHLPMVRRR